MNRENASDSLSRFLTAIPVKKWAAEVKESRDDFVIKELADRFGELPSAFCRLVFEYQIVEAKDEKTWFLCADDYQNKNAFRWNEFEQICLEGTCGNPESVKEIKDLWAERLPIVFAVKSHYAVFCLKFENRRPGKVVLLEEPLFEDETVVAGSYDEFLLTFFSKVLKHPKVRLVV